MTIKTKGDCMRFVQIGTSLGNGDYRSQRLMRLGIGRRRNLNIKPSQWD
jgi:hypothetical protein